MAAVRVVAGLGYGIVTFLFIKNADGLGDYISEIGRTTVHFWSRAPKDRSSIGDGNSRDIGELSDKIDKLAGMRRETVHVHHGRGSGWVTTIVGGTVAVVIVAHVSGLFDFSGIMYVTQSKFKTATEALKEGIDAVSKALQNARKELMERIGLLEKKLEDANQELKDQIASTSSAVRDDLAKVSGEVRDVGTVVGGLEGKLGTIEGGMGELRSAVERANKGIQLLCHVVAESYRYSSGNQRNEKWYSDLLIYTNGSAIEPSTDPAKQLKQNGEGPVMRLISGSHLDDASNADKGGGGTASFRTTLTRQLSSVLDPSAV